MDMAPTPFQALERAVERLGSQGSLARLCGVSSTAVAKWRRINKAIPPEHVLGVEAATGVSRHWLRPDIYPLESCAGHVPGPPSVLGHPTQGQTPDPGRWNGVDRRVAHVTFANGPVSFGDDPAAPLASRRGSR